MRRVRLSSKPGQPGTKSLLAKYGKSLVCVRYRYGEQTRQRLKTVELIVDRAEWRPGAGSSDGDAIVELRVGWQEYEMQQQVKAVGGKWDPEARVWRLSREDVEMLGLESRIVEGAI